MSLSHPATEAWAKWWSQIDALSSEIKKLIRKGTANVSARAHRDAAKAIVQCYFREVRPQLIELKIEPTQINSIDGEMQGMVQFASKVTRTATYKTCVSAINRLRAPLETTIEIAAQQSISPVSKAPTVTEEAILKTLDQVVPTTALSYQQVLNDLQDTARVSYRGTASELREVLRELLDHLAPDADVMKTGIKLEQGQSKPTMKQKTMFILKARGTSETQRKTASDATETVEGAVGSLARSVYNRGSLSTHIATTRQEIMTFKGYAEAVLAELLEIHKAN